MLFLTKTCAYLEKLIEVLLEVLDKVWIVEFGKHQILDLLGEGNLGLGEPRPVEWVCSGRRRTISYPQIHRPVMLCELGASLPVTTRSKTIGVCIHSLQCFTFVKYLVLSGCKYILKRHALFPSFLKP